MNCNVSGMKDLHRKPENNVGHLEDVSKRAWKSE